MIRGKRLTEMLEFIWKAHQHTFAAPDDVRKQHRCATPILPGHKDYHFVDGRWAYHDSYAGSLWAPGSEVVFFDDKPVWRMSYQGACVARDSLPKHIMVAPGIGALCSIEEGDRSVLMDFLREALRNAPHDMPFRGPKHYQQGNVRYSFWIRQDGDVRYFLGEEDIHIGLSRVFHQNVMGALID